MVLLRRFRGRLGPIALAVGGAGRGVGRVDGRPLPARAGPEPPLLRHRHADLDHPHGRSARRSSGGHPRSPTAGPAGTAALFDVIGVAALAGVAPVLPPLDGHRRQPLPRWLRGPRRAVGAGRGRSHPPGDLLRQGPRRGRAHVDRGPLLRALPLALADLRADPAGPRRAAERLAAARAAPRPDRRAGRPVLPPGRAAHPAHRAAVVGAEDAASGRPAAAARWPPPSCSGRSWPPAGSRWSCEPGSRPSATSSRASAPARRRSPAAPAATEPVVDRRRDAARVEADHGGRRHGRAAHDGRPRHDPTDRAHHAAADDGRSGRDRRAPPPAAPARRSDRRPRRLGHARRRARAPRHLRSRHAGRRPGRAHALAGHRPARGDEGRGSARLDRGAPLRRQRRDRPRPDRPGHGLPDRRRRGSCGSTSRSHARGRRG